MSDFTALPSIPVIVTLAKHDTLEQMETGSASNSVFTFSTSARHLMTPIVTIYVGDDRVQYRAYEDHLCRLPFFRAALHGEFKEAVDKTINMPEDDPEAVAVLLEWLAVGTYTFDGNRLQKSTMAAREMPDTTTPDTLLRALFDLEVCVVASKYDAQDLVTKAKESFYKSQTEFKAIDILRLWRAYSTTGLDGFPFPEKSSIKAREIVRSLTKDHRAELVSTMVKSPLLGLLFLEACAAEDPLETSRKKQRRNHY